MIQLSLIPLFIKAEFIDYFNMYGYAANTRNYKETPCRPYSV